MTWLTPVSWGQSDSLYIDDTPRDGITKLSSIYSCQRQIITAEQIKLSGSTKLTDVLQLTDAASFAPRLPDQLNFRINATGTYSNPMWILMVNGQKVQHNFALGEVLNTLGISVNEIERIEIVNTPVQYLGEFADHGIIHIITKNTVQGFHARTYVAGNLHQGNDFYENNSSLMNINQYLGYSTPSFHINFQFGYVGLGANDLTPGPFSIMDNYRNDLYTGRLQLTYAKGKFMQQLQMNSTLIHEPFANSYVQGNNYHPIQLDYLIKYQWNLRHSIRASFSAFRTGSKGFSQDTKYALNMYHECRKPLKKDWLRIKTGFSLTQHNLNKAFAIHYTEQHINDFFGFYYLDDSTITYQTIHPFTSVSLPLTRKAWFTADFRGNLSNLKSSIYPMGYDVTLTLYKRISILSNWSIVFHTGSQSPLDHDQPFNQLKYTFPYLFSTSQHVRLIQVGSASNIDQLSISGNYAMNIGNNFKLYLTTGVNQESGTKYDNWTHLPVIPFIYDGSKTSQYTSVSWVNRFNIHYDVMKNVFMDLNIMRTSSIGKSDEMISNIPLYKSTLIINYQLPWKISLWTKCYYQSKTIWKTGDQIPSYIYQTSLTLQNQFFAELALTRAFLKDKLTLQLSGKNITNRLTGTEQYSPLGYAYPLRIIAAGIAYNIN